MNYGGMYQQPQIQQQYQQPVPVNNNLFGRIVDDFNAITANDVPMQQPATFIKRDGSEIQVRAWTSQGTIATTSYKPILANENENSTNLQSNTLNALNDDMRAFREEINARFDKLEKSIGGSGRGRTKKEVEVNQDESI